MTIMNKLTGLRFSRTYLLLLGFCVLLYLWRVTGIIWIAPVSDHVSNFAITGGAVLLLIGPKDFERKAARTKVMQVLAVFAVVNIIVETLDIGDLQLPGLTFVAFNTADILDMVFGLAAILLVGFLYWKRSLR